MKQVFEIEWVYPERPGMSSQFVADILNQYGPNDVKSVRDITPRWTKELPKEEGDFAYRSGPVKMVCRVVFTHTLGIYNFGGDFVELEEMDGFWSDRPVMMPE